MEWLDSFNVIDYIETTALKGEWAARLGHDMKLRLGLMMFLEFFVWGGFFVTLGSFLESALSASGAQIAMAFSTQSWGAILAPFIVGLIADRYFNAERVLALLHFAGGILLILAAQQSAFAGFSRTCWCT